MAAAEPGAGAGGGLQVVRAPVRHPRGGWAQQRVPHLAIPLSVPDLRTPLQAATAGYFAAAQLQGLSWVSQMFEMQLM